MPVHAGELEFVLEIGHRAQAAQDHAGADLARRNRASSEENPRTSTFGMPASASRASEMRSSRLKLGPLLGALGDADDDAVEQRRGAADQVDVAVRDRIERARINRDTRSVAATGRSWHRRVAPPEAGASLADRPARGDRAHSARRRRGPRDAACHAGGSASSASARRFDIDPGVGAQPAVRFEPARGRRPRGPRRTADRGRRCRTAAPAAREQAQRIGATHARASRP